MIAAIVQARVNSSRLPAKVLLDLAGKPILTRVVERLRMAKEIDTIIVATSAAERDDAIADLSERLGVTYNWNMVCKLITLVQYCLSPALCRSMWTC